jgi:hypothetical protein
MALDEIAMKDFIQEFRGKPWTTIFFIQRAGLCNAFKFAGQPQTGSR